MLEQKLSGERMAPDRPMSRSSMWTWVPWGAQLLVAGILLQTLFFKFTYAPETQVIFGPRGGRPAATAAGIVELVCVILLLIPRTAAVGALMSLLLSSAAPSSHT